MNCEGTCIIKVCVCLMDSSACCIISLMHCSQFVTGGDVEV